MVKRNLMKDFLIAVATTVTVASILSGVLSAIA